MKPPHNSREPRAVPELPQIDPVRAAIAQLADPLPYVPAETLPITKAAGRILAEDLTADRDSPACDVSAMDGYALRLSDLSQSMLAVAGVCAAGQPACKLPPGEVVKIFTGAPVPQPAELIIRREDVLESPASIRINVPLERLREGQNIRRRGENVRQHDTVLAAGTLLSPTAVSGLASFGTPEIKVARRLKVIVLNTGDELIGTGEPVDDWQIRDSNGPLLEAWLHRRTWIEIVQRRQVADRFEDVVAAIKSSCQVADAVILTGGVSMGDADYVPEALESLGGSIAFHRLPIRPGKPILGGRLGNTLVLGLPGNPVSVAVTARVIALPLLERLVGARPTQCPIQVTLQAPDAKTLDLWWYRLVEHSSDGQTHLVDSHGSGDLVSLSRSTGFIEIPPGKSGSGPWSLHLW